MPGPSPSSSNDSTNIPELRSAVIRSSDTRGEGELYFVNTPMTARKHSQNSSDLFESDQWKPAQCLSSPDTESLERLVSTITTVFRSLAISKVDVLMANNEGTGGEERISVAVLTNSSRCKPASGVWWGLNALHSHLTLLQLQGSLVPKKLILSLMTLENSAPKHQ